MAISSSLNRSIVTVINSTGTVLICRSETVNTSSTSNTSVVSGNSKLDNVISSVNNVSSIITVINSNSLRVSIIINSNRVGRSGYDY